MSATLNLTIGALEQGAREWRRRLMWMRLVVGVSEVTQTGGRQHYMCVTHLIEM